MYRISSASKRVTFISPLQDIEQSWRDYREGSIMQVKENIEQEKNAQLSAKGQDMLFDAKRENVALQLEAAYRERLAKVHSEVRKGFSIRVVDNLRDLVVVGTRGGISLRD